MPLVDLLRDKWLAMRVERLRGEQSRLDVFDVLNTHEKENACQKIASWLREADIKAGNTVRSDDWYYSEAQNRLKGFRWQLHRWNFPFIWLEKSIIEPLDFWSDRANLFQFFAKISPVIQAIGVLAIPFVLFSYESQREERQIKFQQDVIASQAEVRQQQAVRDYLSQITTIYLEVKDQDKIEQNEDLKSLLEATTLAIFDELSINENLQDKSKDEEEFDQGAIERDRKGEVIDFLSKLDWINSKDKEKKPLISLDRSNLSQSDLRNANLSGAYLIRADLRNAELSKAELNGANLRNSYLNEADLSGVELREADLRGADLRNTNLSKAKLNEADLSEAELRGADLRGADLKNTNLSKAELNGADLRGANLEYVNLEDANLEDANLIGVDLRRVDLRRVDLIGVDLIGVDLRRANLNTKYLNGVDLSEANLIRADLRGADLRSANLRDANLIGAYLNGTALIRADLRGADLRSANIRDANLEDANLIGADLRGVNLIEAGLKNSKLRGVNLRGANLIRASLIGADLNGADLDDTIFCKTTMPDRTVNNRDCKRLGL